MTTALFALLFTYSAHAEESEFAGTEAPVEAVEDSESTASVELGGVYTSGNAEYYTLNGAANGSHKWDRNKLSGVAGVNVGAGIADADADGRLSAAERNAGYAQNVQRYYTEGRYDRFLSERDSLYLLAGAFVDRFAGYDLRSHEQVGYSRLLVDNDSTNLVSEIGFDIAQENYVDGVEPDYQDIFAARLMLGFSHAFNENVAISDTFELYENVVDFEDLRMLNTAALSSNVSTNMSLKLSHSLIFDNVPVDGFEKLDHTTMVTLVATLL